MCKSRFVVLVATFCQLCWLSFAYADDAAWVRVEPKETDAILANPGMGWETFHRTADDDKNLPSWIPSTVHYARWGWGTLIRLGFVSRRFPDYVPQTTSSISISLPERN